MTAAAINHGIAIMVVSFTGDSGLADYSASLCRELAKLCTVNLVTAESFDEHKCAPNFEVTKLFRRTRHFPLDVWGFVAHVLRTKPKVRIFQSWLKSPALELPLVLFFRALRIRVVLTVHDLLPHYPKPWSRLECALYYKAFCALVVHSHQQRVGLQSMGVATVPLVVPHGVYDIFDTKHLTPSAARAWLTALNADEFVVLFFGHLDERKGLTDFLDAAARMEDDARLKFVVAGKPDGRSATLAALDAARRRPNVLMHDHIIAHEDVQQYFAACNVVALPYREGTTSGVMKLAMAFKRPVVCTDVGDFAESLSMWAGVLVDRQAMPCSLVDGIARAREEYQALMSKTSNLSDDIQWSSIAQKYFRHVFE